MGWWNVVENGPKGRDDLLAILVAQQAASESQIQEQVQWSRETHARMPFAQSVVGTVAILLMFVSAGILAAGIWQATEGYPLWLLLCVPLSIALFIPNGVLAYRIWNDLRKPFGRRSPYEDSMIQLLQDLYGEDDEPETTKERVFGLRSRQKQSVTQERQRQIDESAFASFIMRIPHKGTASRVWESELGRGQYKHFRDELIENGWADWKVRKEDGTPVTGQGWELTAPPREIIKELF